MQKIEIDPAIADAAMSAGFVQFVNEILEAETAGSRLRDEVSASWTFDKNAVDENFRLTLTDGSSRAETAFASQAFPDKYRDFLKQRVGRLWGDYLQARSHRLLESRSQDAASDRNLDGSDALDRIIDSVADYTEREGHEPQSLRLPVRYATALMKLGPAYWGDFYGRIRESGLRAFDGQTLLGMKAELVFGVDAELQVD